MLNNDIFKYCYWVSDKTLLNLKNQMLLKKIQMTESKQNPCEALIGDIGYADPDIWPTICKFDAAPWYNKSKFRGKTLVCSSFRLDAAYEQDLETTLTPVSFDQENFLNDDEKKVLIDNPVFQDKKPLEWDNFPKEMGEQITKGLAKITGKPAGSWEDLFQDWTAVHANFVSPEFRADETYLHAPYSIGNSFAISSCCVELFNLIESEEKALLVRPCTGAVMIRVLEKDRYYFVRLIKNT
jgi:hypothetical protein